MSHPAPLLSEADHDRVTAAVSAAESLTAGEIVTVVTSRSDGYTDVVLAWAAAVAMTALTVLSVFPDFYLANYDRFLGDWDAQWTPQGILALAASVVMTKFIAMVLLQLWWPLRMWLVPSHIKSQRVRSRAVTLFKVGAERRTQGRTGVLIYLSMQEHRAEIVADQAIAAKVADEVWAEAMAAMLEQIRGGRIADGLIAAVSRVGVILGEHFPRHENDVNELPDRLIEV